MEYKKRYETLRKYDSERIGPLKIPIIPPGVDIDKILPLIIEQIKKEKEEKRAPYNPLRTPEQEDKIH